MSRPKAENLALCDELLERAEALERDLRTLARNMPPGVANTSAFITKTADCARVSWPVPAVRGLTEPVPIRGRRHVEVPRLRSGSVSPWRCSWCGARVKVVA